MCLNLFAIYFLLASVREWRWGRYWAGVLCMCGAAFFKGLGLLALVAPAALLLRRRENLRPWLLRACAALAAFVLLFITYRMDRRQYELMQEQNEGQISDLIERWNVRDFDLRRVRATATIIDK